MRPGSKKRVVMVSNRLPAQPEEDTESRVKPVGGLATAIFSLLENAGEPCLWFGWSGKTAPSKERVLRRWSYGPIEFASIDFSQTELDAFYHGFCNRVLWPLFHCFQDRVKLSLSEFNVYLRVNQRFAQELAMLLSDQDIIWVHDYHLLPLGSYLRQQGFVGPIGFFLHIPFPPVEFWQILPSSEELLMMMLAYDLVGFQTSAHRDNYLTTTERLLGASWDNEWMVLEDFQQMSGVYAIGIDPQKFQRDAQVSSRKRISLKKMIGEKKLILGVDRLDYTKGIDARIKGFHRFLKLYPQWRGKVSMIQIAPPSRTHIPEYLSAKKNIDSLVGEVNGEFAEYDWTPVQFLYRSYGHTRLARFYREAEVCLVTPFRDGMNLVAKEYIASQDLSNPGVLVLSRFAGASEELKEAVIVNPFSEEDIARGIFRALTMPAPEKKERFQKLWKKVWENNIYNWGQRFIEDLTASNYLRAQSLKKARLQESALFQGDFFKIPLQKNKKSPKTKN